MEKVSGIGGVFFRARDPEALSRWYARTLGLETGAGAWAQAAGPTVFAPFPEDTGYFDRPGQQWMLNFRVPDLTAMIAQLEAQGVTVITDPDWDSEIGRFARIHDPEGNPVELWEPAGPAA